MGRQKRTSRRYQSRKSRVAKRFFPYPLVIFLFLCVGVFLLALTFKVGADDILVTAKVSAPLVTSPAVITSPQNGDHVSSIPITVSGTCPPNAAYVEIFRNNLMSGSAICSGSGTFQLIMDLFPGQNNLVAHVFNSTDDEGPVSATITVYYDVIQPSQPSSGTTTPDVSQPTGSVPTSGVAPLVLKTAFVYKGYYVGQQIDWPLEISGGVGPYAINIDWGDGNSDLISRKDEGQFRINHIYKKPGGYMGSYIIKIKGSDLEGRSAYLEFFVIVNAQSGAAGNIFNKKTPTLEGNRSWLWVAWPAYAILFVMVVSYRLGEKEEFLSLKHRGLLRRA